MEAWRSLIRRAVSRLEAVGLDRRDWVWGGGTVLMLRYLHRQSHDIDIFINDVQYLSYLSPRLNDRDSAEMQGYSEQANHLRLEYPEGELDFLTVAPVFPDLKPQPTRVEGVEGPIQTMRDKEILGQKLHYRAAGFTGRDLYDFVAVAKADPGLLSDRDLHDIARQRRDALAASLSSPNCERGYLQVERPSLTIPFSEARAVLLDWIEK
ncbi:nucleotidyl transferase AbiEii/AbiGii toxin family protein [Brucella sp. IR073]|uniref:nucleotidyl transferase AbiEii/AbiGii toxin family protein n=1 Tax=unclassified Brucella TaxID=2632610 RepID=UPI003B9862F1